MAVVKKNHFKLNNNAKHLKQQSNSGIAVIVKGNNNMLFATIVEKLQGLIKERGYVCLIYYIDEDENEVEQALQICRERQPMGILFLGSDLEYYRGRFGDAGIPGLLVTNSAEGMELENLSSVSTDDEGAAQTAIEYLFTLGHKEIGVLAANWRILTQQGPDIWAVGKHLNSVDGILTGADSMKVPDSLWKMVIMAC